MWSKIEDKQVSLQVYAKPHSKRTGLLKIDNNGLHIGLHAKPHEGEANKELIFYLAILFRLPKSSVVLQRGQGSRHKVIVVPLSGKIQQFLDDQRPHHSQ